MLYEMPLAFDLCSLSHYQLFLKMLSYVSFLEHLLALPLSLAVSASGAFGSESIKGLGLVAKIPFITFWGFEATKSLLQHSPASSIWVDGALIMGLLRDREDSASVCSKKTYFTASNSARPRVITCSRSTLHREDPTSRTYSTTFNNRQIRAFVFTVFTWRASEAAYYHQIPAS